MFNDGTRKGDIEIARMARLKILLGCPLKDGELIGSVCLGYSIPTGLHALHVITDLSESIEEVTSGRT
jgi:hypothetical protein